MTITVRNPEELQRVHDILATLVLDERLLRAASGTLENAQTLITALNVLCWILKHEHNDIFARFVFDLECALASMGITIIDLGRLQEGRKT